MTRLALLSVLLGGLAGCDFFTHNGTGDDVCNQPTPQAGGVLVPANVPLDPGNCDEASVVCDAIGPACPTGTVQGVKNGCYSGYCIPISECPFGQVACEQLPDQATCETRPGDCEAVFVGDNCTCDPAGNCTCQTEKYDHCTSVGRL